jgi:hypothetical protein
LDDIVEDEPVAFLVCREGRIEFPDRRRSVTARRLEACVVREPCAGVLLLALKADEQSFLLGDGFDERIAACGPLGWLFPIAAHQVGSGAH